MKLSNMDKVVIVGVTVAVTVAGAGVLAAASIAETKNLKPKQPKADARGNDEMNAETEISMKLPDLPKTKDQLYTTVGQNYVNNKHVLSSTFCFIVFLSFSLSRERTAD